MHTSSILRSILFLTVLIAGCSSQPREQRAEDIQSLLDKTRSENGLPGLALAMFSQDSLYYADVVGLRRLDTSDSLQVSDRFHLGSCTKAFIAFASVSLVDEGAIDWDTRFFDLYPELRDIAKPEYHEVNFRQLLKHKGGLVSKKTELYKIMFPNMGNDTIIDRTELFTWAMNHDRFSGGFQYSNTGYVMAAHMLEKVTGTNWQDIVCDRVFEKLEIEGLFGWPAKGNEDQPWGHYSDPSTGELIPHDPMDVYYLSRLSLDPAGDISMSMHNYVKFLQDNLRGCAGNGGILSEESYSLMHSGEEYGLGWGMVDSPRHGRISSHSGAAGTFYCKTMLFKDHDLGLVILTNSHPNDIEKALFPLIEELLNYMIRD